MKAVRIHRMGAPEVLTYEDVPEPTLGPGQVLLDVKAIGVNYNDVLIRKGEGSHNADELPITLGREASGIVLEVGEGVTDISAGDLVAYRGVTGSYAERVAVPARLCVPVPEELGPEIGAGACSGGQTAHYLAFSTCPLNPGDPILVHAGAGGTGLMLVQMAKMAEAYVYVTVSTEEKARIAKDAGADHAIIYTEEDFEEAIKRETDGKGVKAVFDAVGKDTFQKSLNSLARRGYLVLYGQTSGPIPLVDTAELGSKGSLFVTRASLNDYTADREELLWRSNEVYDWIASGKLTLSITGTFPLSEAAEAHRLLEGRKSTGKLMLTP